MRKEIQQLIDKLDEPYGLVYYKGISVCNMNCEELRILCMWLAQIHFKGDPIAKEKYYVAHIDCHNCEETESVNIPKGTTIRKYKNNKVCSNCGCMMGAYI